MHNIYYIKYSEFFIVFSEYYTSFDIKMQFYVLKWFDFSLYIERKVKR